MLNLADEPLVRLAAARSSPSEAVVRLRQCLGLVNSQPKPVHLR